MNLILAGKLAGVAFACGLNLYITVAALGILSRLGLLLDIPPGLQGLQGGIVIATALALYLVEAIVDKVPHIDSLWDIIHTFIRPPAAALLAVGALWGQPLRVSAAGATLALLVALAVHGSKAGLRMSLNATMQTQRQRWISTIEDALAVTFAVVAFWFPVPTLAAVGIALLLIAIFGRRLWRAFHFGNRCVAAWLRSIFVPGRWRDHDELPRDIRRILGTTPLGSAPPRGARATLHELDGAGVFRNGWLVLTPHGPSFVFRTLFRTRRVDLPERTDTTFEAGAWANIVRARDDDRSYTLFMLKDGPSTELVNRHLTHTTV